MSTAACAQAPPALRLIGDVKLLRDIMIRSGAPGDGMFYDAQQRPRHLAGLCAPSGCAARYGARAWTAASKSGATTGPKPQARPARHRDVGLLDGRPVGQPGWPRDAQPVALGPAARANLCLRRHLLRDPATLRPARKALAWSLIQTMTLDRQRQLDTFRAQDAFPALLAAQEDPFFDRPALPRWPACPPAVARPGQDSRAGPAPPGHLCARGDQRRARQRAGLLAGRRAPLSLTPNACWPCAPRGDPMNRRPWISVRWTPIC